ncbi:Pex13 protein [Purpureocillium lilacinum]|uniref:Peroxisomal membrane protein PEX13 n=1 Tax=Purpureocillium lilacinum TaxID=33203 RepID=A0A179GED4_PURLI|nr:Pex13 protein [Purpureocillium lilacinum]
MPRQERSSAPALNGEGGLSPESAEAHAAAEPVKGPTSPILASPSAPSSVAPPKPSVSVRACLASPPRPRPLAAAAARPIRPHPPPPPPSPRLLRLRFSSSLFRRIAVCCTARSLPGDITAPPPCFELLPSPGLRRGFLPFGSPPAVRRFRRSPHREKPASDRRHSPTNTALSHQQRPNDDSTRASQRSAYGAANSGQTLPEGQDQRILPFPGLSSRSFPTKMASPPKPWERPGVASVPSGSSSITATPNPPVTATAAGSTTLPGSSTSAPPVPDRPSSLTSAVNQNAAAYSRMGVPGVGASPYSAYGGGYSSPYSSPYSRFGGIGGYAGGMYGGYGGYGGGMGGGMYGNMYGGMPGMPGGDPNSLTNSFSNSTAATFQMLEGIVTAFGGFAQMLETMVSVAEQFGNLRDTLGSILGIFTLIRWIRTLIAKITGRPPPADATALTPAAFARFEGRPGPDGSPGPAKASRKPLLFFLAAAFGLPYLMSKMIRTLSASHEEEERRLQQQALQSQQPVDPSKLEFCRLLYDFLPQPNTNASMELEARKGDLVAVLSKNDPAGQPSEWWQCRSRDGRQGYLPATYLEVLKRPGQEVKQIKAAGDDSRTNSITSAVAKPEDGKKEYATADGMQRSHFYS